MLHGLITAGVDPTTPPGLAKRLRLANRAALVLLTAILPLVVMHVVVRGWPGLLVNLAMAGFLSGVLTLNLRGYTTASRALLYASCGMALVVASAAYGLTPGILALFVAFTPLPFLLIEPANTHRPTAWSTVMACSALAAWVAFGPGYTPPSPPSPALTPLYVVLALVFLGAEVRWFYSENAEAERRLRDTVQDLEAAQSRAEAASQAKSDFVSFLSHEIRNPLSAIMGLTDLALLRPMDARQRQLLTQARSSSDHLLHLLNDVLDLRRIESGKLHLEPEPTAIDLLVSDAVGLFRPQAEAAGQNLTCTVEMRDTTWRLTDPTRLKQVLLNLISNSVKFTPRGGQIRLTVTAEADGGVTFGIRDSGPGLTLPDQERVFAEWEQAGADVSDKNPGHSHGGAGLGLHISRRLVEVLGGTLSLESTAGAGTHFWFTLPLPEADGAPHDARPEPESRRVLVAIADPELRGRTIRMLTSAGYAAIGVDRGAAALLTWQPGRIDVTIMGLDLPDLPAFEVCTRLRGEDPTTRLYLGGVGAIAHLHTAALEAGATALISLPLSEGELGVLKPSAARRTGN